MLRIKTSSRTSVLTTRALFLPPHPAAERQPATFHHCGTIQSRPANVDNTCHPAVASSACARVHHGAGVLRPSCMMSSRFLTKKKNQNPPSIPTLALVWLFAKIRGSKIIIDWHNTGYSILALRLGDEHILVKFARASVLLSPHSGSSCHSYTALSSGLKRILVVQPMLIYSLREPCARL